jgi:N-acetylglucosaminyl-diphospho-decaprenol L-rhamnosyltransferase
MNLSIICVNWNSVDYLRECIASIYQNTRDISFEIIVVDNASPQGGVEALKDQFPQITIVKSDRNLGFAGANNVGFEKSCGDYALFLNPDTELVGPAINTLMERIQELPDAGIVGGKLLNSDMTISTTSIQKFPTILNQILNIEYLRVRWPGCPLWGLAPLFAADSRCVEVDVIPGACMLMSRDTFRRARGFSEDYFMYAEDIDLNLKVRQLGLKNYYVAQATVIHHGGKSSSRQKVNQWSTMMKYRAMLRFYKKTRGQLYGEAYRTAMGLSAAGRLVVLALAFPFGDRDSVRSASAKWNAVLKWAVGRHEPR